MSGEFFPPDYKRFAFAPGDFVADEDASGWGISRVLRVDDVPVRRGETIMIAGQAVEVTADDSFLIVACAIARSRYGSLDQARRAVSDGLWTPDIEHAPMRATFLPPDAITIGHAAVRDDELAGYRIWREAFARGEAGTF